MKSSRILPAQLMKISLLLSLLVTTSGFAQQEDTRPPEQIPAMQNSELDPDPETEAGKTQKSKQPNTPPATRFIPSEKIHADDAVSFPVDI